MTAQKLLARSGAVFVYAVVTSSCAAPKQVPPLFQEQRHIPVSHGHAGRSRRVRHRPCRLSPRPPRLPRSGKGKAQAIDKELRQRPAVRRTIVPAMVIAIEKAQEAGIKYNRQ